jgi:DNA polymerase III subunit epsilon
MKPVIFFDTETTGLPVWGEPSNSDGQPHIVEIGAILADEDTREVISEISIVIQPDGWLIPEEMTAIHGISQEKAAKFGMPENLALHTFWSMWNGAKRVAHNAYFDQRIIRIAMKRFGYSEQALDAWADKETLFCTMQAAKPVMQLEPKVRGNWKNPKLSEAYEFYTQKQLIDAHKAIVDARACMEIYWAMQDEKEDLAIVV